MMYIANDGSYGDADGIVILDTAGWTGDDWKAFNEAVEDDDSFQMMDIAEDINRRYK